MWPPLRWEWPLWGSLENFKTYVRFFITSTHWELSHGMLMCLKSMMKEKQSYCYPLNCKHVCVYAQLLSHVWLFATSGSSVHGIFQARYWSGLPFPTLGDLPDPGIEPTSLATPALAGRFFTTVPPGKPTVKETVSCKCVHSGEEGDRQTFTEYIPVTAITLTLVYLSCLIITALEKQYYY